MSKTVAVYQKKNESQFNEITNGISPLTRTFIPQAHLHITCPCGEEHKVDLNDLPASTSRRVQIKTNCEYAEYFIVHTGHSKYRKILLIANFGE